MTSLLHLRFRRCPTTEPSSGLHAFNLLFRMRGEFIHFWIWRYLLRLLCGRYESGRILVLLLYLRFGMFLMFWRGVFLRFTFWVNVPIIWLWLALLLIEETFLMFGNLCWEFGLGLLWLWMDWIWKLIQCTVWLFWCFGFRKFSFF